MRRIAALVILLAGLAGAPSAAAASWVRTDVLDRTDPHEALNRLVRGLDGSAYGIFWDGWAHHAWLRIRRPGAAAFGPAENVPSRPRAMFGDAAGNVVMIGDGRRPDISDASAWIALRHRDGTWLGPTYVADRGAENPDAMTILGGADRALVGWGIDGRGCLGFSLPMDAAAWPAIGASTICGNDAPPLPLAGDRVAIARGRAGVAIVDLRTGEVAELGAPTGLPALGGGLGTTPDGSVLVAWVGATTVETPYTGWTLNVARHPGTADGAWTALWTGDPVAEGFPDLDQMTGNPLAVTATRDGRIAVAWKHVEELDRLHHRWSLETLTGRPGGPWLRERLDTGEVTSPGGAGPGPRLWRAADGRTVLAWTAPTDVLDPSAWAGYHQHQEIGTRILLTDGWGPRRLLAPAADFVHGGITDVGSGIGGHPAITWTLQASAGTTAHVSTLLDDEGPVDWPDLVWAGEPTRMALRAAGGVAARWRFGDGSGAVLGRGAAHVYRTPGVRTATVRYREAGRARKARRLVLVLAPRAYRLVPGPFRRAPGHLLVDVTSPTIVGSIRATAAIGGRTIGTARLGKDRGGRVIRVAIPLAPGAALRRGQAVSVVVQVVRARHTYRLSATRRVA